MSLLYTLLNGEKTIYDSKQGCDLHVYYFVKYPPSCSSNAPKDTSVPRNKKLFKVCLSQTNIVLRSLLSPARNKAVSKQYSTQVLAQIHYPTICFQF